MSNILFFNDHQPSQVTNYYFDLSHASVSVDTNNSKNGTDLTPLNSPSAIGYQSSVDWIAVINIIIYAILAAMQTFVGIPTILFFVMRC